MKILNYVFLIFIALPGILVADNPIPLLCGEKIRVLSEFPAFGTYEEITVVSASDLAGDVEDLITELKTNACQYNADAIVVPGILSITGYKRNLSASAIRFITIKTPE